MTSTEVAALLVAAAGLMTAVATLVATVATLFRMARVETSINGHSASLNRLTASSSYAEGVKDATDMYAPATPHHERRTRSRRADNPSPPAYPTVTQPESVTE